MVTSQVYKILHDMLDNIFVNHYLKSQCLFLFRYLRGVGFWKLRKTENWRICLSTRPVMSLYVIAYCLAVLITLLWVAAAGGLKKRSDA